MDPKCLSDCVVDISPKTHIDAHASVDPKAQIGAGVHIGPYCVVGPHVTIDDGVHLHSHVVVDGRTRIGPHVKVFPFSTIGVAPQHLKYNGELTCVDIGAHTEIRENVTIHRGTVMDQGITSIGQHCLLMVGCHVAHDCRLGNHIVLANQTTLGGHVVLDDHVYTGGVTAVLQFVRLGRGAMVAGFSGLTQDLPPYGLAAGTRCSLQGLNMKKLQHLGVARTEMHALRKAYDWIFYDDQQPFQKKVDTLPSDLLAFPTVQELKTFLAQQDHRPICTPPKI